MEQFKYAVAMELKQELQMVAPVDTAWLKMNIKYELKGDEIIITMPEYWAYLEYGTGLYGPKHKKYEIKPKNKKALSWEFTEGVGGRKARLEAKIPKSEAGKVAVKKVMHPGIHPFPFVRNTLYHKFNKIVEKNAEKYLNATAEVIIE
jgi:hypothetical protein